MERQEQQKASRLVFVLYPSQGHINPMLQLATILHSKGFSITIIHPKFNSPNSSNYPEFTFIPISDNLPESQDSFGDIFGIVSALNKNCEGPLTECIQQMLKAEDPQDRLSCIVYDSVMHFSQSVADHLKLPGISVRTGPAATMFAFAVCPRLDEQGYISFLESMSLDGKSDLLSLLLKELAFSMKKFTAHGLLELRAAVTDSVQRCSALILNTVDFIEQEALTKVQELFSASAFTIGPFHKLAPTISSSLLKEDSHCISWLNKQAPKSVIYVSFGSVASIDEKELLETAWGLANCEQPFLWVVRPGLVRGSNCSELLPINFQDSVGERGCIVEWAPQKEVLANDAVGGFWSHCGWNSTLESICEGIPMLCRPFFGDQNVNRRYVCDVWNVGLELEEFERGRIEKAIKTLMVDTEGEEMRKKATHLKEKVELSLKEGGSCYNSLNDLAEKILSFRPNEDGASGPTSDLLKFRPPGRGDLVKLIAYGRGDLLELITPGQGDLLELITPGRGDLLHLIAPGRCDLLKLIELGQGDLLNHLLTFTWRRSCLELSSSSLCPASAAQYNSRKAIPQQDTAWSLAKSKQQPFLAGDLRLAHCLVQVGLSYCPRVQRKRLHCEMSTTERCLGSSSFKGYLKPLWLYFNPGKYKRRSSTALRARDLKEKVDTRMAKVVPPTTNGRSWRN
ncbi:UDP-glycosyltransferase 76B1 [Citrus sinensis]|nr:UDP-glycosyltransferase 76B1 [Citrus sinensis]